VSEFDALKLDKQLCFPLYAASRLVVQAYGPYLAKLGITYPQYLVLLVIWEHDGSSVKEIGCRLYLDSGTLTPILKKLEKLKLVERKRCASDDRAVLNYVTELGWALRPKALELVSQLACDAQLPEEEAVQTREMVVKLLRRFCHLNENRP
jgi:DNA-binding MarR family transcriptional regulator